MSDEQSDAPKTSPDLSWPAAKPRPIQFRLASALVFTALSALVFSLAKWIGLDPRVAAFSVFFLAIAALLAELMRLSESDTTVVLETSIAAAAESMANLLRHHGIRASVVPANLDLTFRVIVPPEQGEEAMRLLNQDRSSTPAAKAAKKPDAAER